jgi:16S rRNA (cytidine1402-2'-O)-methyltransferase
MLTLIPTPIDEIHPLESSALNLLKNAIKNGRSIICVEEAKIARRRWIRWGLDREYIEHFKLYNEHTRDELAPELIKYMIKGYHVYLMSDCGLPAFCDPGKMLVDLCHKNKIKVSATPFYNSPALALALSGFDHEKFNFEGFISTDKIKRKEELNKISKNKQTTILMDTPYRLNKLLGEIKAIMPERDVFIGMDLNKDSELLIRDKAKNINLEKTKQEFIMILGCIK